MRIASADGHGRRLCVGGKNKKGRETIDRHEVEIIFGAVNFSDNDTRLGCKRNADAFVHWLE